jgi:general secretion pathway protein N
MDAWRRLSVAALFCMGSLCMGSSPLCAADPAASGDAVINPVAQQPLDQLSVTHGRPLFSPTRRPPPKPVAAAVVSVAAPPPAPPPSLVLLGVVSADGDGRAAIRSRDKDKVVQVRLGDDVGGWKVERIEPRRLVLTLGERSVDFSLFSAAAKGAKSADAAAPERRARQVH